MLKEMMSVLTKERPTGTAQNASLNDYLEKILSNWGYSVDSLPFFCQVWKSGKSQLLIGDKSLKIYESPFSEGFHGKRKLKVIKTLDELKKSDCKGKILILKGELAGEPLQPKDYPFYYPDEHKLLIDLLEEKEPAAIIAVTAKHPSCGLEPYPLFEDGNFLIPSAFMSQSEFEPIEESEGQEASLTIGSGKETATSRQLVAHSKGEVSKDKIVLCAHMDSKYNTPGALDNAAGLAVLLKTAEMLASWKLNIDIVPFNGEEYYEASGEMQYLANMEDQSKIKLVINLDSPCHVGSQTAISFYNFSEKEKEKATSLFKQHPNITEGEPWYAGDHCAFAFQGLPCMAVTSSDLFEGGLKNTHTPKDTLETVDPTLIQQAADYIADYIRKSKML